MKRYRILNWTVLGLLCYIAALPAAARAMRFIFPQLWQCSYRRMTGTPCPFCGTTGDLSRMWSGNFDLRNPVTPYLAAFILAEFAWRLWLLSRKKHPASLPRRDLIAHLLLLALLLGAYLACWD
ncbi:MAG: hypothetical protein HPZ91_14335 [Lentisphaeria bacterium]|nr:hypothetical protein [Lentisphaeria bacterium]